MWASGLTWWWSPTVTAVHEMAILSGTGGLLGGGACEVAWGVWAKMVERFRWLKMG